MGFEPTPLRTGALSQRLRPLGQTVLSVEVFCNIGAVVLRRQAAIAHTKVLSQPGASFNHSQDGARRGATPHACSLCSAAQISRQLATKPPDAPAADFTPSCEVFMHTRRYFDRPCGLMDKALVFGTKDCRFESCQGHGRARPPDATRALATCASRRVAWRCGSDPTTRRNVTTHIAASAAPPRATTQCTARRSRCQAPVDAPYRMSRPVALDVAHRGYMRCRSTASVGGMFDSVP